MATKQKILIVDDDTNIAELISLYLTKECFETCMVEDGEAALKAFEEFQPNLILLDLMLPGIDGYEVCRTVRKTYLYRLLCCRLRVKFSIRSLGWSLVPTIT